MVICISAPVEERRGMNLSRSTYFNFLIQFLRVVLLNSDEIKPVRFQCSSLSPCKKLAQILPDYLLE